MKLDTFNRLCNAYQILKMEGDCTHGIDCPKCGVYSTHAQIGTYEVIAEPPCPACGEQFYDEAEPFEYRDLTDRTFRVGDLVSLDTASHEAVSLDTASHEARTITSLSAESLTFEDTCTTYEVPKSACRLLRYSEFGETYFLFTPTTTFESNPHFEYWDKLYKCWRPGTDLMDFEGEITTVFRIKL